MKITIDTHNCSREELAELKEYLENESWDFKEEKEEKEENYRLVDIDEIDIDSGLVILSDKIRDEELHEFYIVNREELIEDLMGWISEGSKDKQLMKQDLEMLMKLDDEYILSSNSTNDYIDKNDSRFDETCKELIELNETL